MSPVNPVTLLYGQSARAALAALPADSVYCVVTSPPYWGLRDYGGVWSGGRPDCPHANFTGGRIIQRSGGINSTTVGGGKGQSTNQGSLYILTTGVGTRCLDCGAEKQPLLGEEPTVDEYVTALCDVLDDVRRVLRPDGTLWLNLGDSYSGSWGNSGHRPEKDGVPGRQRTKNTEYLPRNGMPAISKPVTVNGAGVAAKQLVGVPWRVAFECQRRGWYLRSDIVWAKRNGMPESTRDRPTKAHEYVFLLAKSPRYFYDWAAVLTESQPRSDTAMKDRIGGKKGETEPLYHGTQSTQPNPSNGSRLRDVWWLSVGGYKGAHFATFPVSLPLIAIRAGTADCVCGACGTPFERVVETARQSTRPGAESKLDCPTCAGHGATDGSDPCEACAGTGRVQPSKRTGPRDPERHVTTVKSGGFIRACQCPDTADTQPAVVLDPFSGAATTGLAARMLGRRYIGIDIQPAYLPLASERLAPYTADQETPPCPNNSPDTDPSCATDGTDGSSSASSAAM